MFAKPDRPICLKCNRPVDRLTVGKEFRRAGICYFESECHGDKERVEYWPITIEGALFVPEHAFPAEHPPDDAVRADPPEHEPTPLDVQDELMRMPEWKMLTRIQHFGMSIRLFEQNADELDRLLLFLTDDPASMPLTDLKHRAQLDLVFEEVLRKLHNFVAAAQTLVDHTRVLYVELYEENGLFPDYEDERKRRLVDVPMIRFVQDLRNLAQHVRLPNIVLNIEASAESGIKRRLLLQKEDLLGFSGWKAAAKTFLDAASDHIDVSDLIWNYRQRVRDFYEWMEKRQQEIHAPDIAAVQEKQSKGRAWLAREMPSLIETGLAIWNQGVGSLRDVFVFALSPRDWGELSRFDQDIVAWIEAAITLTEQRFGPLPPELAVRIRDAARGGT